MEAKVQRVLDAQLSGLKDIDVDVFEYVGSMIADVESHNYNAEALQETVGPFLLSSGLYENESDANNKVNDIIEALRDALRIEKSSLKHRSDVHIEDRPQLLDKMVRMKDDEVDTSKADLDFMWGTDKIRKQYNQVRDWDQHVSKKDLRKAEREQEKFLAELEMLTGGIEDDGDDDIAMMVLPDYSSGNNEKDIHVHNFNIEIGGLVILEGADLKLSFGRKYGLTGKNGIGKTTLLRHMASYDIEGFPRHHRVLHVRQEIKPSERSVLDVVLDSDIERMKLIKESKEIAERASNRAKNGESGPDLVAQAVADTARTQEIFDRMTQIDAHTAEARAAVILHGLGFSEVQIHGTTNSLSGGWRMRVAIAGALFIQPEVLMLDEPTNHLDLEAVIWLQEYLKGYPKTLLLVSHDRAFLNEVCTDTIHLSDKKLNYYKGNYNTFEVVRSEQLKNQRRAFEANKAQRQHMQEFIDKFRYNAKRASLVQSRIKALDKMEEIDEVTDEIPFEFSLPEPGAIGRPVLGVEGVSFGYDSTHGLLFQNVHFGVDMESRIAVVGPNGAGKSTLLNVMMDKLKPVSGYVHRNPNLKIAAFTQHHAEQFDYRLNAVDNMLKIWPLVNELEMRSFLGKFRITGNLAIRPLKFLSGGQKSRVAFAALAYSKPHMIIMDEPTNHLDMETINALVDALKEFKGAVICVSHDQHFISQVCTELWVVGRGKCAQYKGTFADYKADIMAGKK